MQANELKWGVLGPGTIAKAFAQGVAAADAGKIVALGARNADKAKAFADELGLTDVTIHGSYEALLADDAVQAVYVATPHPLHARWAIAAAEAGKHVFVEKPAGLNEPQVMAIVEAARVNGVFFMEAFKDRCHPQNAKLAELLNSGVIGEVRTMATSFGFDAGEVDLGSRLFDPKLAGGAILDVGCYCVQHARFVAGALQGRSFADPVAVRGAGHLGQTGVDEWASAVLKFDGGFVAEVATAVRANLLNQTRIDGSEGHLVLEDPWVGDWFGPVDAKIDVFRKGEEPETYARKADYSGFGYEALAAATAIAAGQTQCAFMTWEDSIGQAVALDAWRKQIGLTYPNETPEGITTTIRGTSLSKSPDASMTYGKIEGLDKPIAKLIMGCDNQPSYPHAAVMFDDYWQRGGNAFDTAFIYGGGQQERQVGAWIRSRGVRNEAVVISKGCHTPFNFPSLVDWQVNGSLERLGLDHADVYLLHRDNPDVPAGEFIDALHEQAEAGRIGVYGGSNWSLERIAEANAYAEKYGKRKMACASNNVSLARMVRPVWDGCIHASDPASIQFLADHQLANFAWSSQARGYFVSPDAVELQDEWTAKDPFDSPDNRQRRLRAFELAEKHGVTAINIAAAYVLQQPFPSFALIGPRRLMETVTSVPALSIQLTAQEHAYLDLRADTPGN
ncbi:MAG: aldo/keto reductase [Planctomycetota bacterium]